jgi:hypothetical protein
MSEASAAARPGGLRYSILVIFMTVVLLASAPLCWTLQARYGLDKELASNLFFSVFSLAYAVILAGPWLKLKGQENIATAERLEKMCVAWLFLTMAPHLLWELPWVVAYDAIMAGEGQMWAYAWWAYMDGGDQRYVAREVNLLACEIGASTIGILLALTLLRWRKTRSFSNGQLMLLMALMVADFYPTYLYYATEIIEGFPNVRGPLNLFVKFVLANSYWLVMPWVVFLWAGGLLMRRAQAGR